MASASSVDDSARRGQSAAERRSSGAFVCRDDDRLTLVEEDGALSSLTGYRLSGPDPELGGAVASAVCLDDLARLHEDIDRQLSVPGNSVAVVECRLVGKDGETRWIGLSAEPCIVEGARCLRCVFSDSTAQHRMFDELAASEGRYAYILSKTEDTVFEWDCATGEVAYSPMFERKFGRQPLRTGFPASAFEAGIVHPDDVSDLEACLSGVACGDEDTATCEHRMLKGDGTYLWARLTATGVRGREGKVERVIGLISDIEDQKRSVQQARERAQRDPLTGLYNQGAVKELVQRRLAAQPGLAALVFVDVDDFKNVNDTLGHVYGDGVLGDIASRLQELFPARAVLGRIGGDEFVAFLDRLGSKDEAEGLMDAVLDLFRRPLAQLESGFAVSASAGVAYCPEDGTTYRQLFERADCAMYAAKTSGKNRWRAYRAGMEPSAAARQLPARVEAGPSCPVKTLRGNAVEYLFRFFLDAPDADKAVPQLLGLVGRQFSCRRVVLFEAGAPEGGFSCACEWHAPDADPWRERFARASLADIAGGRDDVLSALAEGRPLLAEAAAAGTGWRGDGGAAGAYVCPVGEQGATAFVLVFELQDAKDLPGSEAQRTLLLVAEAVGLFLSSFRRLQRLERHCRFSDNLLARLGSFVYGVDPATYRISFVGGTGPFSSPIAPGDLCYRAVRSFDAPCPDCPMAGLEEAHGRVTRTLYHPGTGRWLETSAALLPSEREDGSMLCLVCSHDITAYVAGADRAADALRIIELQNQLDLYRTSSRGGAFVMRVDCDFTLLYGNDIFYSVLGIEPADLEGRLGGRCAECVHPQDLARVRRTVQRALDLGEPTAKWEMRLLTGDGSMRWAAVAVSFENRGGDQVMNGFVTETTELHELLERAERSEERYRIALSQTNVNVWEYDFATRSITVTESSAALHGYSGRVEDVPERLIADGHIDKASEDDFRRLYARLRAGEPHVQADILTRKADGSGTWWERISYTTLFDETGEPVSAVAVGQDVTRQRDMELAYRRELQMRTALSGDMLASSCENLTRNEVQLLERRGRPADALEGMTHEELVGLSLDVIPNGNDRRRYADALSREALLRAFGEGRETVTVDYRKKGAGGRLMWANATMRLVRDTMTGDILGYGTIRDIDDGKRFERAIVGRVERDPVTGAYSRETALGVMDEALSQARREGGGCTLLVFRVDRFGSLVGQAGCEGADSLLKELAAAVRSMFGTGCIIGRLYGDELAVLLHDDPDPSVAACRAQDVCRTPFSLCADDGLRALAGVSCRVAFGCDAGAEALYRRAVDLDAVAERVGGGCEAPGASSPHGQGLPAAGGEREALLARMADLERRQEHERLHDGLTGMENRAAYLEYRSRLQEERLISLGIMVLDIDGLKGINRRFGTEYGDARVLALARILEEACGDGRAFRFPGDDFLVAFEDIDGDAFDAVTAEVRRRIGTLEPAAVSTGAVWTDVNIDVEAMIDHADELMMVEKRRRFKEGEGSSRCRTLRDDELRRSIDEGRFRVFLQPKACVDDGRIFGAEALVRGVDADGGIVAPVRFVPMLEREGLIRHIDLFVFDQACAFLRQRAERGLEELVVSLNFSRATLVEEGLVDTMERIRLGYGVDARLVEVEITESLGDLERDMVARLGRRIRERGYRLALDDFGARYSNVSVLSSVDLDVVKIDKVLVDDLLSNDRSRIILAKFLGACRELGIDSIAEGVEALEQLEILKGIGCDGVQGYCIGRPLPLEDFDKRYGKE